MLGCKLLYTKNLPQAQLAPLRLTNKILMEKRKVREIVKYGNGKEARKPPLQFNGAHKIFLRTQR